jgi:hypothetical protein
VVENEMPSLAASAVGGMIDYYSSTDGGLVRMMTTTDSMLGGGLTQDTRMLETL